MTAVIIHYHWCHKPSASFALSDSVCPFMLSGELLNKRAAVKSTSVATVRKHTHTHTTHTQLEFCVKPKEKDKEEYTRARANLYFICKKMLVAHRSA